MALNVNFRTSKGQKLSKWKDGTFFCPGKVYGCSKWKIKYLLENDEKKQLKSRIVNRKELRPREGWFRVYMTRWQYPGFEYIWLDDNILVSSIYD